MGADNHATTNVDCGHAPYGGSGHYPRSGADFDHDIIRAELDDAIAAVEGDGLVYSWFDATTVDDAESLVERTIIMTYTPASDDDN
jgi:hypothetical protein